VIRRANEGIRWPPIAECRATRRDPEAPRECLCRAYDGAHGYYLVAEDRHAYRYATDRKLLERGNP